MFKSFDVNGDGYVSMEELDKGLKPKTRKKIEMSLEGGWKFDAEKWAESVARHKSVSMADVFANFDADGDGKLTLREFMRAFRALGLPKRDGSKVAVDEAMFKSFDTNGDGFVTLTEFEENLLPKTRKKIELKIKGGWCAPSARLGRRSLLLRTPPPPTLPFRLLPPLPSLSLASR